MELLFLAFNAVLPIFLLMIFGYYLKQRKFIDANFINVATKFVFRFSLPTLVFMKIASIDRNVKIDTEQFELMILSFFGAIIAFLITSVVVNIFHKISGESSELYKGAMNQGSWRSNYLIVGYPILYNLFGDSMILNYALLTLIVIPLFNVLATITLSNTGGIRNLDDIKKIGTKLIKNPLILGVLFGFLFNATGMVMPIFISKTMDMVASLATPLGLISIGAFFHFDGFRKSVVKTVIATSFKLIIFPLLFSTVAYFMGFSTMNIIITAVLFGGPAAVSSFAMAKEMGSDANLAGNIVILSSLLCSMTYMLIIMMWLSIS